MKPTERGLELVFKSAIYGTEYTGMICPICGKTCGWITYNHAESHGMTREELRMKCKPFGAEAAIRRVNKKRKINLEKRKNKIDKIIPSLK